MHYTTLGRTGLNVSVAGLGCGGNSRIGLGAGLSTAQSVALMRDALDLGVNLIDTAEAYGTEEIVGEAIKGRPRDGVVVSTKAQVTAAGAPEVRRRHGRQPGRLAAPARHRLRRHLPPARPGAGAVRPRHRRVRAGPAAREAEGQAAPPRRLRDGPARPDARDAAARRRRAGLRGRHAGLPHAEPERAAGHPEAHPRERHRHAVHVRRAQHLLQARPAASRPSPTSPPRASCRPRSPPRRTRSASSSTRAAPTA